MDASASDAVIRVVHAVGAGILLFASHVVRRAAAFDTTAELETSNAFGRRTRCEDAVTLTTCLSAVPQIRDILVTTLLQCRSQASSESPPPLRMGQVLALKHALAGEPCLTPLMCGAHARPYVSSSRFRDRQRPSTKGAPSAPKNNSGAVTAIRQGGRIFMVTESSVGHAAEADPSRTLTEAERITARLDRLPMTRSMWTIAFLVTFGGLFDAYAIGLIGAVGPGLFKAKIFTPTTASFFGLTGFASFIAVFFAGLFVAALCVSYIADRFGRRSIFAFALLWFGVANFIMGTQNTANSVNVWRFVSALGIGLELVTVDAYLSELVPRQARGMMFGFLQVMGAIAFFVAYLLSWQLTPISPFGVDGWRWVTWIGSIAAVVIWWIRLGLPESPRWLAQQGRLDEAEQVMSSIEVRVQAESGQPLPAPQPPAYHDPRQGSIMEIFRPHFIRRTIMLVLFNFFQTVGFYGFVAWVPTLLIAKGIHVTQSLEYSMVINITGVAFSAAIMLFADRLERRLHCAASCLFIAVFGLMFANVESPAALIVVGACLSASTQWLAYALHNYQAELYPTRIRARAVGFVYSWSRLSGILTPFFVAFFLRNWGAVGVFAFVAFCMALCILMVMTLGPRTTTLQLEAIAA